MTMPYMDMHEIGYMSPQFGKLIKKIDQDFEVVTQEFNIRFEGMLTAKKTETVKTKNGVRDWLSCKLYTDPSTKFESDDIILLEEGKFQVVSPINWGLNGYKCYLMKEVI